MVKDFEYFVDRTSKKSMKTFKATGTRTDKMWTRQMASATGDEWKDLRSTFSPIFTTGKTRTCIQNNNSSCFLFSGKIKAMMLFMQHTANAMLECIDKKIEDGSDFELKDMMGRYSMDTIASCAFGVDAQAFTNEKSLFVKYASNAFSQGPKDMFKVLIYTKYAQFHSWTDAINCACYIFFSFSSLCCQGALKS